MYETMQWFLAAWGKQRTRSYLFGMSDMYKQNNTAALLFDVPYYPAGRERTNSFLFNVFKVDFLRCIVRVESTMLVRIHQLSTRKRAIEECDVIDAFPGSLCRV